MSKRVFAIALVLGGCVSAEESGETDVSGQDIHRHRKVTLCHRHRHTIHVPTHAVRAHRAHGDTFGRCRRDNDDGGVPPVCTPGSTAACYDGPDGTEDVGTCAAGTQTCNAAGTGFGACVGAVTPADEVCGDGLDDDCDGIPDDSCVCVPSSTAPCYDGPADTEGVGTCAAGTQTCSADGTGYGACVDSVTPVDEVCGNGLDDNCDGVPDDECVCVPDSTTPCYDGPSGTEGVGTCAAGAQTCNADGTGYGACVGAVTPVDEVCDDGLDDDCDGVPDDSCVCVPDSAAPCYDGPADTEGVGACAAGTQTCNATGTGYGACTGSVTPEDEVCINGVDDDCDGAPDDGCVCAPDSTAPCYDGPPDTDGVGACAQGTQTCNDDGTAYGACVGSVTPTSEICGNGLDENCDGVPDDSCVCAPSSTAPCYDGPAGTEGVGTCAAGSQTCNATGTGYGACVGSVIPMTEICHDGVDDDCNGAPDDAANCTETACMNRADDDLDGASDCADSDCANAPNCIPEAVCGDGIDNDLDRLIDCVDPDCVNGAACITESNCGDGIDNDSDGRTDCAELGCELTSSCQTDIEFFCNDGVDNDSDGRVDAGENECTWAVSALPGCAPGKLQAYRVTGPLSIPDPPCPGGICTFPTREVSLVAAGPGTVGTAAVQINLVHGFLRDVSISLVSTLNTTIDISSNNGVGSNVYSNTVFVDSALTPITAAASPFPPGPFRPEQPLSTFIGEPVTGTWRGVVADNAPLFNGTLHIYSLAICIQ